MEVDLSNLRYWCNDKFYPLMHDTHRYMVLMGGGGSGKSHFCAQKIVYRMLADPGIRILVVRKVKNTIKESVFTLLRDIISEWELSPLFKYNMSDYGIMCVNGSQVITAGLDKQHCPIKTSLIRWNSQVDNTERSPKGNV